MDDIVNSAERFDGSLQLPALVLIEPLTLTRTCILNILRRELLGFDIIDIATTDYLNCTTGRDISRAGHRRQACRRLVRRGRSRTAGGLLFRRVGRAAVKSRRRGHRTRGDAPRSSRLLPEFAPGRGRRRRLASCARRRSLQAASDRRAGRDGRSRTIARAAVEQPGKSRRERRGREERD